MVAEARRSQDVGLVEIPRKGDAVEERSLRIPDDRGGGAQDGMESFTAPRRANEDAKSPRGMILEPVIESDFPLPTVQVLRRSYPLGAGVYLKEEAVLASGRFDELPGCVGEE